MQQLSLMLPTALVGPFDQHLSPLPDHELHDSRNMSVIVHLVPPGAAHTAGAGLAPSKHLLSEGTHECIIWVWDKRRQVLAERGEILAL